MSETLNQADKLGGKILEGLPTVISGAGNITGEAAKQLKSIAETAGTHVNDAAQKFLSFAEAEAPQLLWEIIAMARVQSGTRLAIFVILAVWLGKYFYTKSKNILVVEYPGSNTLIFDLARYIGAGGILSYSLYMIYNNVNEWILPFVAPRLYLLNYMKELVIQLKG